MSLDIIDNVVPVDVGTLPVSEIFGPTIQGEGPFTGRSADFIRLGGCNLTCKRCDTPYTWDASRYNLREQLTPMTAEDIIGRLPRPERYIAGEVHQSHVPLVVITGGEPLLYQRKPAMSDLLVALQWRRRPVQFETNGTLAPHENVWQHPDVYFVVSPKLLGPMSEDPAERRIVPDALHEFAKFSSYGRACFKFVCSSPTHLGQVRRLAKEFDIQPGAIWIMPEGVDPIMVQLNGRDTAQAAIDNGYNISPRLHVLLWPGTERGR
jgi:organic radical activating enzyme